MDIQEEFSMLHISTGTTTTVFSGPGQLGYITINTTAAGAVTIKDGTSTVAVLPSNAVVGTYWYKGTIANGLSIVTAAASDITVGYKHG